MTTYYVDVGYACGPVITDNNGKIIDAMPILRRRYLGSNIKDLPTKKIEIIDDEK